MTWVSWIAWACVAINLAGACVAGLNIRRLRRMETETLAMQDWYAAEAERLVMLDFLLMRFCIEAACDDCGIVWQAWAQTLGEIRVQIGGRFRGRDYEINGSLPSDHDTGGG